MKIVLLMCVLLVAALTLASAQNLAKIASDLAKGGRHVCPYCGYCGYQYKCDRSCSHAACRMCVYRFHCSSTCIGLCRLPETTPRPATTTPSSTTPKETTPVSTTPATNTTINPNNPKNFTFDKFKDVLDAVEKLFPDVPPEDLIHKLRMLVSRYDTPFWKTMYLVNDKVPFVGRDVSPFPNDPASQEAFDYLRQTMLHSIKDTDGDGRLEEQGVIKIGDDAIALGHVITGIAAGYDRHSISGMDNLAATTISGDLGQSGHKNQLDSTKPLIGPSGTWNGEKFTLDGPYSMATDAEILGDIDGYIMGSRVQNDPTTPISSRVKEYYKDGGDHERRFEIFKTLITKQELQKETEEFADNYEIIHGSVDDIQAAENAVNAFCARFNEELGSWCN
ncbi:uncharacterized protein LOC106152892 [Lingula anatina]|uniref:Uncharacterized protein LOC106152892 n=1 Tax=Lingula anatina TaxID=7574 RepID=A0A1S3H7J5_LINAN|nr:uncharacterized protein LOC106152892 [Lingula anatina]|eukprot:XP_013382085.1 uncharacterized protein LOC106152892 [Lingula anatina]